MGAIVSDDYREEQRKLKEDPVIIELANEMRADSKNYPDRVLNTFCHDRDHTKPNHVFMGFAIEHYRRRCKYTGTETKHHSIGGPAKAILAIAFRPDPD